MSRQERLRAEAQAVASRLAQRRDVTAVLLYGSVARGDADGDSDIDLLVVGRRAAMTSSRLRQALDLGHTEARLSLVYHTPESLRDAFAEGSRFLVHIRREGIPLLDPEQILNELLSAPWTPMSIDAEIELEAGRLAAYDRPEVFGGHLLFPLAHVYTIGKAIVMARLADVGTYEFNRRQAFASFAAAYPEHASNVQLIQRLEPFRAVTHRISRELPFDPYGSAAPLELTRTVAAARRLATIE